MLKLHFQPLYRPIYLDIPLTARPGNSPGKSKLEPPPSYTTLQRSPCLHKDKCSLNKNSVCGNGGNSSNGGDAFKQQVRTQTIYIYVLCRGVPNRKNDRFGHFFFLFKIYIWFYSVMVLFGLIKSWSINIQSTVIFISHFFVGLIALTTRYPVYIS